MSGAWVAATLVAAVAQTARNAAQANLTAVIGTAGATQVRFLFGLPFAILFLGLAILATGQAAPVPGPRALGFATMGALAQIGATALMLLTMKTRSFAVTTAWIKTEPVIVALAALAVLGDPVSNLGFLAIAVATSGVILTTLKPGSARALLTEVRPALGGLAAASLFGLSAVGFRGAILALPDGGYLIRATTILVLSLGLQTLVLLVWLALFDRPALAGSLRVWRASLGAGFLGAFASQFWFLAFSLTTAANVRTLALVEVILAQAVSLWHFRQPVTSRQMAGMALIVAGVGLLLAS